MPKYRNPLPQVFPHWIQRRIEIDNYRLYQFMEDVAQTLKPDDRVLDAGAGEGKYRDVFAHTAYVGVDLAIGDVAWNYRDLDVIGDLSHLPFAAGSFDAVVCTQVLEHVPEPGWVLAESYRALKPGGRLFLSAPQSWYQHQKPYDYYRYTSFGLRYLIEKAGFEVLSIENLGGYFWYLSFTLQHFNYWLFPRGMRGRWLTWPLRALFGLTFGLIVPLVLFPMDALDRTKDETFGYVCIAVKPETGKMTGDEESCDA